MFHVKVFDVNGHDALEYREFDLAFDSSVGIGRSSRNAVKASLKPAANNFFVDSPVISRDHAVLTANENGISITDSHSMHGTFINKHKIEASRPEKLSSGDHIQLGVDVNRNEEFFVARKYKIEYNLTRPSYSLGFTVPESEEEGSQHNPLTLDSNSDCDSHSDEHEQVDETMIEHDNFFGQPEEIAPAEHPPVYAEFSEPASVTYPKLDDESMIYNSEGEIEMAFDDGESINSVNGSSEVDYSSDVDMSNDEDEADPVDPKPETKLESGHISPVLQANLDFDELMSASVSFEQGTSNTASDSPSLGLTKSAYESSTWAYAPPLPPRPSAHMPSAFGRTELPSIAQSLDDHAWFSPSTPTYPNYVGTNHGDRPALFSPAPAPIKSPQQEVEAMALTFLGNSTNFAPIAGRLQIPPANTASDNVNSTPPAPNRTKVSIGEILEGQPPTPTSVNSMKRKADVLEEETKEEAEIEAALVDTSPEQPVVEVDATPKCAIIGRPKKQPRSLVSKLKNTATYLGYVAVGAASSVAVLSYLPDSFFT